MKSYKDLAKSVQIHCLKISNETKVMFEKIKNALPDTLFLEVNEENSLIKIFERSLSF